MNGKLTLYMDQHGCSWLAKSAKDLRQQIGKGRIEPMLLNDKSGKVYKIGYVIGRHWCRAFTPYRAPV